MEPNDLARLAATLFVLIGLGSIPVIILAAGRLSRAPKQPPV